MASLPARRIRTAGGVTREYRLVVPKSIDLDKPAPLVIAFHGMLIDSKDVMPLYTKLNETAAKYQFMLVYPNAIDKSWESTRTRSRKTWTCLTL